MSHAVWSFLSRVLMYSQMYFLVYSSCKRNTIEWVKIQIFIFIKKNIFFKNIFNITFFSFLLIFFFVSYSLFLFYINQIQLFIIYTFLTK